MRRAHAAPQAGQQLTPAPVTTPAPVVQVANRQRLAWSADWTNPQDTYPFAPPVKLHAARCSDGTT
jgi:hypothetical protein